LSVLDSDRGDGGLQRAPQAAFPFDGEGQQRPHDIAFAFELCCQPTEEMTIGSHFLVDASLRTTCMPGRDPLS